MTNDLRLLAYVPNLLESARKHCAGREEQFPYFRQGYVDMDLGRHTEWTDVIREATEGYALADKAGKVVQTYRSLLNAEQARLNAVIRVVPEVEIEPDEAPDSSTPENPRADGSYGYPQPAA